MKTTYEKNTWIRSLSYLSFFYNDTFLACGTGVFWKQDKKLYLLTNWHNVTGRHFEKREPLSKTGGIPNKVHFTYWEYLSLPQNSQYTTKGRTGIYPLYLDDSLELPNWGEHRYWQLFADVVCLDITNLLQNELQAVVPANILDDNSGKFFEGQEIIVGGYHKGLRGPKDLRPQFIQGKIISDPNTDYSRGWPIILVDAATETGMSGSLVLARTQNDLGRFLGIYSGRINKQRAKVGYLWKRKIIEELTADPIVGIASNEASLNIDKMKAAMAADGLDINELDLSISNYATCGGGV